MTANAKRRWRLGQDEEIVKAFPLGGNGPTDNDSQGLADKLGRTDKAIYTRWHSLKNKFDPAGIVPAPSNPPHSLWAAPTVTLAKAIMNNAVNDGETVRDLGPTPTKKPMH